MAIASKFGYESCNQTCTISLIEHLKEEGKIDLDEKFIKMFKYPENEEEKEDSIIELREDYTYSTKVRFSREKIDSLIILCKELIDATRQIVLN